MSDPTVGGADGFDGFVASEFTARIPTTDGDDQTIQTTGEIGLVLSLPPP